MPRAPRQCPIEGCDQLIVNVRYCDRHRRERAWTSANRPAGTPSRTSTPSWRKIARAARIRDGNRCVQCGADGRIVRLECDHILNVAAGGTDSLANAQMLCVPCHRTKTQREANAGRE